MRVRFVLIGWLLFIPSVIWGQSAASPYYVILTDAHGFVYVDAGSQRGIRPGMAFRATRNGESVGRLMAQDVDVHVSRTVVVDGMGMRPGDLVEVIPNSTPVSTSSGPPHTPTMTRLPWLFLGGILSASGAAYSFHAANQASDQYAAATTVDNVDRYARQRDGLRKMGWAAVGVGSLLIGLYMLRSGSDPPSPPTAPLLPDSSLNFQYFRWNADAPAVGLWVSYRH